MNILQHVSFPLCTGPAEVPMMSPNGSIPPIHVPPGYISQVLEDNTGVRRVVVTPQSPECYPPSYSPAISPTHHLPPYMAPPPFIPNSHTAFYPPVSPGDIPPHQYYQHHIPPMYNEGKKIIPVYGMNYIGRDEQYKPPPKKMKDRLERQNRLNSPPSIYKSNMGCNNMYNGYSKVHGNLGGGGGGGSSPGSKKNNRGARSSPRSSEPDLQGKNFCRSSSKSVYLSFKSLGSVCFCFKKLTF
ncbi:Fibronectin type III domain-containing protein 3B [Labeo rohita]|uniref:Fibronectin type III domain-containing protein 3B n=1 Tax=Labeo rohita TaxID=84645 RepID=A0ABQ8MXJ7_LABRO|nr:Fibronectin type III domain-containing protein 3B [Labeo rohita]